MVMRAAGTMTSSTETGSIWAGLSKPRSVKNDGRGAVGSLRLTSSVGVPLLTSLYITLG